MLFITVRSASSTDVPKVLQVVEHVKRLRHKRGELTMSIPPVPSHIPDSISAEVNSGELSEELHQYVIYDNKPSVGLQRIKLDDPPSKVYTPPSSLNVHLSKIPMPELRPHPNPRPPSPPPPRSFSASSSPSPRQPPPPWPQARASSAPREIQVPTTPAQQPQQPQTSVFGSLLWGQPRKWQH
jgi:hypothetical protein